MHAIRDMTSPQNKLKPIFPLGECHQTDSQVAPGPLAASVTHTFTQEGIAKNRNLTRAVFRGEFQPCVAPFPAESGIRAHILD